MKTFSAPHPNLTARFVESEDIENEDDSVELTHSDGKVIGWINICDEAVYGTPTDYTYTIPDPQNGTHFFTSGSESYATYNEAGAAFVKRCAEEGITL